MYEIDDTITGFGYEKDPRIQEILNTRNQRKDLSDLMGCTQDEITLTDAEAEQAMEEGRSIVYHSGDLNMNNLTSTEGLVLPQYVGGYLDLSNVTSLDGVTLPQSIGGGLYLSNVTSLDGTVLPQRIGGYLDLNSITSLDGVIIPEGFKGRIVVPRIPKEELLQLQMNRPDVEFSQ